MYMILFGLVICRINHCWLFKVQSSLYMYIYIENDLIAFLIRSLIFIIKDFRTTVFILVMIFKTFRPRCPPAFFRCFLSNSEAYTELRTIL